MQIILVCQYNCFEVSYVQNPPILMIGSGRKVLFSSDSVDKCEWNESIGELVCDCGVNICGDVFVRGMSCDGADCLFEYCGHTALLQDVFVELGDDL